MLLPPPESAIKVAVGAHAARAPLAWCWQVDALQSERGLTLTLILILILTLSLSLSLALPWRWQVDTLKEVAIDDFKGENYERAVKHLTVALSLDEKSHVLYSNRCTAYIALESYDKAMEDADECVRLQPSWAKGYLRRGSVYFRMGQLEKAEVTLTPTPTPTLTPVYSPSTPHPHPSPSTPHPPPLTPHPSPPHPPPPPPSRRWCSRRAWSSTRATTRSKRSSRR